MNDNDFAELGLRSFGDANLADVRRGFFDASKEERPDFDSEAIINDVFNPRGGFLGRPGGWER